MSLEKPKSVVLRAIVQNNCCVILLISRNKIHLGAIITYYKKEEEERVLLLHTHLETEQEDLSKKRKPNPMTFLIVIQ